MDRNLEDFPNLSKWVDDVTIGTNMLPISMPVVDADSVERKLIELGSDIEFLLDQLYILEHLQDKDKIRLLRKRYLDE